MAGLLSAYHRLPPRCQDLALSAYGLTLRQLRYGKTFHQALARLEAEEVDPFLNQRERLQEVIAAALRQTEHYGKLFDSQSLNVSDIDLNNFASVFPVLEKATVKKNPAAFHRNNSHKKNTTTLSTSGTTGTPLNVLATKTSVRENYAFFNLFLRSIGVDEFQRSATFAGRLIVPKTSNAPPYWRKNYAMNTLMCSSYHLSAKTIPFYIKALEDWQPNFIDSYPSAIYEVASFINTNKVKHRIQLKTVITSSETLGDHQREAIEQAFQCPVFDQYGCAEMAVVGYQQKDGRYYMPPQYSIVEVLDDDDRPVVPGESGHLVCTGILNEAMPLIRYRMGDIVKTSKEQVEGYPYILFLDSIEGRTDDVVVTSSGARVGRLGPIFKGVKGVSETQIIQKTPTLLQVNLIVASEYTDATETQIRDALKNHVGVGMQVSFDYVTHIPREKNGKFKFVKSEL